MSSSMVKQFTILRILGAVVFILLLLGLFRLDRVLRLNLGYIALAKGEITGSMPDWQSLTRLFPVCKTQEPMCTQVAYGLGLWAESVGDDAQVLIQWEKARQLAPDNPLFLLRLGSYWQQRGDEKQALAYWRKANAQTYWTAEGDWWRREGRIEDAISAYRLALQIDPEWLPARQGLALVFRVQLENYWSAGQFDQAIPLLQEIAALSPRPWDFVRLGDFARDQGDLAGAIEWYEKGISQFHDFAQYPLRLAQLARDAGDWEATAAYSLRLIQLEPENAQAHFLLGVAYLRQGKLDQAEEALLAKNHLAPDEWGYARLGDVYLAQGRLVEAEAAYQQALRIAPDMAYARQKLQQLHP
jgi:tetratricopeptide (TPR) repeat protein